jgi:hypothetical protein
MHGITVQYQRNRAVAHLVSHMPKVFPKCFKVLPAALRVINSVAIHPSNLGEVNGTHLLMTHFLMFQGAASR